MVGGVGCVISCAQSMAAQCLVGSGGARANGRLWGGVR